MVTHGGDSYCVVWVESLCVGFGVGYVNVYLNARGGLWLTRVALARCGGSRWARRFGAMRQWERGWERGVSVCLFVTFCHFNKYAFTVVRYLRLEGVGFLLTALLGFCETVFGPFGRHTRSYSGWVSHEITSSSHLVSPQLPPPFRWPLEMPLFNSKSIPITRY